MSISIFELFSIGIGPSSSHTVGPMRAAKRFAESLAARQLLPETKRIKIELFGSLAHTGKGHGSNKAVLLGLMGFDPETVDIKAIPDFISDCEAQKSLPILNQFPMPFHYEKDILFRRGKSLSKHPNGMQFTALGKDNTELQSKIYFSIGGGFLVDENTQEIAPAPSKSLPYPFASGDELLALSKQHGLSIATMMLENEKQWHDESTIKAKIHELWAVMKRCIDLGCQTEGVLPGGLKVTRRAPAIYRKLKSENRQSDKMALMDWVDLFALAVNEENAAGGRVVTAPTNGAAGIIPAVLNFQQSFYEDASPEDVERFFLTAGAIGLLYKINASISGAEVGCQGEVGVACSMAAAGLTEVLGGTPLQVENAAEIGMEHNLGLTCDPVGGLVQVPCIERNAMGAIKAINASRLALRGDGSHKVSLDKVIKTMRQTGADMRSKYKETARGGLAVNIIEC